MSQRSRLTAVALALVGVLVAAGPAAAINPVPVDPPPGVTAPMGIFRDTNGALWVADSHAGICRLADTYAPGAGLVPSGYCDPTGLLATRIGPVAPGQSAFDRATGNIYVGDLASASGGVWRLHLDQTTNPAVLDGAVKILDFSLADRVFGMSYFASGSLKWLDFSTKNAPTIQRVIDPATCPASTALTSCQIAAGRLTTAGAAEANATGSLAHDATGNLYIADLSGVTRILKTNLGDTQARPVPGLNLGAYTAVAYDDDNKRIYAGTTNPEGVDWIDVLDLSSNKTGTYSVGFDGITALAADPGSMPKGRLDVIDDPGVKQVGEDLGGTGRRFTVDFEQFVPPPTIVDGPPSIANVRVATFVFTNESSTTFFCSLDRAPATQCGAGTSGRISYEGLGSGAHSFTLFGNNPVTGPRTIRRFAIDTHAPVVSIDTVTVAGSAVEFGLSSDEINVDYTCRLDSGTATLCDTPMRYAGLADGPHTFTVFATDFVGNVGNPKVATFTIGVPAPPPWKAGKVKATLRGTKLRVVFNAPPAATFARFTLSKTSGVKVRTKPIRIKGGVKNTITITLTRDEAERLQRRTVTLKIIAGASKTAMSTKAGQAKLTITAPLTATTTGRG